MTSEAVLNLVWLLLCLAALAYHCRRDRWQAGTGSRAVRLQRTVSVLVAAIALFPVISASDDRLGLAGMQAASTSQPVAFDGGKIHDGVPAPLLEDPEHGQTTAQFCLFAGPLALFAVAPPAAPRLTRWFNYRSLGRAPPSVPVYG